MKIVAFSLWGTHPVYWTGALRNAELVLVRRRRLFDGLFWRFLPASDPTVDVMISRDCDSRICEREAAAVTEWLASNKDFHLMRDHPCHRVPVLGGMWGCRNHLLRGMKALIGQGTAFDHKGCDQKFLAAKIYPRVRKEALEHSEFDISFGGVTRPFPSARRGYEFVGEIFDENDVRSDEGWRIIEGWRIVKAHIHGT
jgi:hypothetical protein